MEDTAGASHTHKVKGSCEVNVSLCMSVSVYLCPSVFLPYNNLHVSNLPSIMNPLLDLSTRLSAVPLPPHPSDLSIDVKVNVSTWNSAKEGLGFRLCISLSLTHWRLLALIAYRAFLSPPIWTLSTFNIPPLSPPAPCVFCPCCGRWTNIRVLQSCQCLLSVMTVMINDKCARTNMD